MAVIGVASGKAEAVRLDPARMPYRNPDDVDAAWIERHFRWERDAAGRERLLPRRPGTPCPVAGPAASGQLPRRPLRLAAAGNTMASLPGTLSPNPGDRSGNATARRHKMHGIRAVRRESGTKDPPSRKAPRVFSFPAPRRPIPDVPALRCGWPRTRRHAALACKF
jgi:hypothetical protein